MGPRFSPQRTLLYATSFLLFSLHATYAQQTFTGRCQVISTPLQVRTEGITARLGDITLVCTGGAPGSLLSGNLILFFPVLVTNRVDTSNLTHDAAVSIDTGSGFVPSAVPGLVSSNSISFNGLSFMTPTGNISLKISGIRGAVNQLGLTTQQPVLASLSGSLPLNQAQVVVAYPLISLQATLNDRGITCTGSPTPGGTISQSSLYGAGTAFSSTRLTEGYASAFETRQPGTDNGVRILLKYSGFPANAHIYIPDAVAGSDAASPTSAGDLGLPPSLGQYVPGSNTLVLVRVNGADANGAGGFQVFPPQGTGPQTLNAASEVQLTNGSGYAVYEVADANPAVQETAEFPTFITLPSVAAPAVAQESVSLAPVSSVLGASTSAPIVRFVNANVAGLERARRVDVGADRALRQRQRAFRLQHARRLRRTVFPEARGRCHTDPDQRDCPGRQDDQRARIHSHTQQRRRAAGVDGLDQLPDRRHRLALRRLSGGIHTGQRARVVGHDQTECRHVPGDGR